MCKLFEHHFGRQFYSNVSNLFICLTLKITVPIKKQQQGFQFSKKKQNQSELRLGSIFGLTEKHLQDFF